MDARISRTKENLKRHNINCFFVEDEAEAREKVLELVEPGALVGLGGSMTVHSIGVVPELAKRNTMHNPYDKEGKIDKSKNQRAIRKEGLVAGLFPHGDQLDHRGRLHREHRRDWEQDRGDGLRAQEADPGYRGEQTGAGSRRGFQENQDRCGPDELGAPWLGRHPLRFIGGPQL
jgi:hypothetical protein